MLHASSLLMIINVANLIIVITPQHDPLLQYDYGGGHHQQQQQQQQQQPKRVTSYHTIVQQSSHEPINQSQHRRPYLATIGNVTVRGILNLPPPQPYQLEYSQPISHHRHHSNRYHRQSIRRQLIIAEPIESGSIHHHIRTNRLKNNVPKHRYRHIIPIQLPSHSTEVSNNQIIPVYDEERANQQSRSSTDVVVHRTAPDTSAGFFSKALENVYRFMPPMRIGTRQNPGCVGGTKCQFFVFCWMSGGSLGASCGPLHTCCVTPSSQDIQPQYWGPVINDPQCGKSATRISRIVGGSDASFGQFPWQAFVQVGGSRCGGALVGPAHVVTAGHCVARSQHNPSSIRVTLGDYILHSEIESLPHEVFTVSEVKLHPNFRFTPQADRYDVAVLVLDRSVQYRENIMPICLPPKGTIYLGRMAYVAGWGALQAGSKLRPKVLQHVPVPVIENPICEGWHKQRGINIKIYDEMMCAGYESGGKDACQGDSGGPLMLNEFGVWYLIGIVSAGYSCAKQYQPGIYHRVSSSSDWVSANVFPSAHFRTPS